jgi:hypothetical protein
VRINTSSKGMIFAVSISDKRALKSMYRLIHPSAWKWHSQKFALQDCCEASKKSSSVHRHLLK